MEFELDLREFGDDPNLHIWDGAIALMLTMVSVMEFEFAIGFHVESEPRMWFLEAGFPLGRVPLAVGMSEETVKAVGYKIASALSVDGHEPMWIRVESLEGLKEAVEAVYEEVSDEG